MVSFIEISWWMAEREREREREHTITKGVLMYSYGTWLSGSTAS
jgi:hypothetical protein